MIATLGRFAREQIVELAAAAAAAAFLLSGRVTWERARAAIDADLLLLLFALLVTIDILRRSGYIDSIIAAVVRRFTSTRTFAAVAIAASGLLAAFLTNDVALFAIIPLIYSMSILLSQVISNVPATILLTPTATSWPPLLYGVNAGGCGTIIASLANLLGWRIYVRESNRDPRFFWRLTGINFAFLIWAGAGDWLLLRIT